MAVGHLTSHTWRTAANTRPAGAHQGRASSQTLAHGPAAAISFGAAGAGGLSLRARHILVPLAMTSFLIAHRRLPRSLRASQRQRVRSVRLGREDQSDGDVRGLPVLTDDVCLIPGDSPIVRVEDAPGNARRIFTGVDIRATVEEVWQVMTNYEALETLVPNLVQNRVLRKHPDGGARLWQVGRASWRILNKSFFFQAGTTLDVHLHPDGCPDEMLSGTGSAQMSSSEAVREEYKSVPLRRGVFPRPFSVSASGHRDITFENCVDSEARGDFVHYRGLWRFELVEGCALPGEPVMRLTFAVECEPHWFLPVAPVEGRIATAMAENMAAIRDYVESRKEVTKSILDDKDLVEVLDTPGPPTQGKLSDIEWYAQAMSGALKPVCEAVTPGSKKSTSWRQPLQLLANAVPSAALRIFLSRLAVAPNPVSFLFWQTKAGISVSTLLVQQPNLLYTFLVHCPQIFPHLPAIYTRLSVLEPHIPAIIRILDPYLQIVRPELDRIMERMDEIEPHLPYILLHLDILAKHCGKLLDHFDKLLPFAYIDPLEQEEQHCFSAFYQHSNGVVEAVEFCVVGVSPDGPSTEEVMRLEIEQRRRSYLPQLLPYVDMLVPHLDDVSDHLPYIRPHLPYILPYMDAVLPYVGRFKDYPAASKNADVLTAYLGWLFALPAVPRVLNVPGVPRFVAALSRVLPRWPVRGLLRRRWRRFHEKNLSVAAAEEFRLLDQDSEGGPTSSSLSKKLPQPQFL